MGNVVQAGVGQAPAKIKLHIRWLSACTTINKVCASGESGDARRKQYNVAMLKL
jgi:hypothetical protein